MEDDSDLKLKKKTKYLPSPSSAVKLQQRFQLVQNYLLDQHPNIKRQLFPDSKSGKRRKTSLSISIPTRISNNEHCTDHLQSKLFSLESLIDECLIISTCALKRARLRSDNEQTWQKLTHIERDLETLLEKFDTIAKSTHNSHHSEKSLQNLAQLLTDWNKYEVEFDQQFEELVLGY